MAARINRLAGRCILMPDEFGLTFAGPDDPGARAVAVGPRTVRDEAPSAGGRHDACTVLLLSDSRRLDEQSRASVDRVRARSQVRALALRRAQSWRMGRAARLAAAGLAHGAKPRTDTDCPDAAGWRADGGVRQLVAARVVRAA